MLDDLVHLLGRKQPPVPAFVPGLTSTPPTRALPARTRRRRGRILGGRNFRELRFSRRSSLEPLVRFDQLAHSQQQCDSRLAIAIKDRLGFSPLHTSRFAAWTEVPSPG